MSSERQIALGKRGRWEEGSLAVPERFVAVDVLERWFGDGRVRSQFEVSRDMNTTEANKQVERTAAPRFGLIGDGLQTAVVAVVSTLPAAVAHPGRSA